MYDVVSVLNQVFTVITQLFCTIPDNLNSRIVITSDQAKWFSRRCSTAVRVHVRGEVL